MPVVHQVSGDNQLYGRVVTTAGEEFEGYVRWDKNEGSWADRSERLVYVSGVTIGWNDNDTEVGWQDFDEVRFHSR